MTKIRPRADLIGAQLAWQDLRGANLRDAYLIAADPPHTDQHLSPTGTQFLALQPRAGRICVPLRESICDCHRFPR
ncbi:pentapeptide repeat-containing protein [Arthrobacter terrae]|uniref:pentapeptide repeat-containing protein n=1 Tax=Arthrobacter terrae TaxID=2935737 RepID=UPI0035E4060F